MSTINNNDGPSYPLCHLSFISLQFQLQPTTTCIVILELLTFFYNSALCGLICVLLLYFLTLCVLWNFFEKCPKVSQVATIKLKMFRNELHEPFRNLCVLYLITLPIQCWKSLRKTQLFGSFYVIIARYLVSHN